MTPKFKIVRSETGGCCLCLKNEKDLYIVRDSSTGNLTALCSCCLLSNVDSYVIDNTRPWPIEDKGCKC